MATITAKQRITKTRRKKTSGATRTCPRCGGDGVVRTRKK